MCETNDNLIKGVVPKMKGKPEYKDAPRFPMIYDYEGEFKRNYNKTIKVMVTEIATTMMKIAKEK